ncbi:MAG: flavodoxin domain-containing protein [Phycisphaerae bacterium]|nr:flavodoxin domain-containing protein [Phycisphaerae bacterium]
MPETFNAVEVADNVYWVGGIDWDMRNFHGYLTSRGTTYNAFLIMADKITLVDTVKAPFADEMFARIASVVDPRKIDYIISNHSEMDHTGALPRTIHRVKPEKVFASKMGQKALANHFHMNQEITVVGDGDSLDLGDMKLSFVETRMCHWPDSMVSYLHESQLLFSQDAFGMHLAGYERFADEFDRTVLDYEAAKYYANILLHLSGFIKKTLDKLSSLGLELGIVAPDHGPIWRRPGDIKSILDSYVNWAAQKPTNKAVVVYDTMWNSTAKMARAIGEGLAAGGAKVKLMSMSASHRSDVITELLDAGALVVGSPTMNNNVFPSIADVMTYVKGLKPQNLVVGAFGSYGWSGEAPKHLHATLKEMGLTVIDEPLRVNYVPDDESLAACRAFGLKIAEATLAAASGRGVADIETTPPPQAQPSVKCMIDINDGLKRLEASSGRSLFEELKAHDILLPTICGGEGLCGCCKVTVLAGGGEVTPVEHGHLSPEQLAAGQRLGCQVRLQGDLAIRLPVELLDAKPFRGKLESMTDLTHDIKMLRIRLVEPERISFLPGQYIKLDMPGSVEPSMVSRAFSIASRPGDDGCVELIIRHMPDGICTNWIFGQLKVGDEIIFSGPYGEFRLSDTDRPMAWIAGGSGLSPFWSILRNMAENDIRRECTLFFGAVGKRDLLLLEELRQLESEFDWFTFVPALSSPAGADDWVGQTGLITEVLDRNLPDGSEMEAYLCGSPGMIAAACEVLNRKGIPAERTFYDEFM